LDWLLTLRAFAKALVLPPAGPLIVAVLGLAIARRAPRSGRALAWIGVIALVLLSTPLVAAWLMLPFDVEPFDASAPHGAQAVVILGGGTRRDAPEYGADTLGRLTLERVRFGARVAKQTALPVLVTGGRPHGAHSSEAQVMRDALAGEYGVDVRWLEERSRNTHENARYSSELLRRAGVKRVVLVAHEFDMPRATAEFADAGIETVIAPTGLRSRGSWSAMDLVPSPVALQASHDALYELLANAVRPLLATTRETLSASPSP
jgi:uncharacterized SAM-binding protein YcdF (DUF218 family)